eukprot:Tbor_TRINITY_DN2836_c0_g1::TRINITY_DN2836_c0_g1_i1::g.23288::m.23288/K00108/betA, CHDH; choline dehydrogenase
MLRTSSTALSAARQGIPYTTIVIGGGTAGCLVAGRLAMEGHRVCLIEQGPDTTKKARWHSELPCGMYAHRLMNSGYETRDITTIPQKHLLSPSNQFTNISTEEDTQISMPYPKVLGGSGVVGGRSWIHGNRDDWTNTPWNYSDEIAPQVKHFESVEIASSHRGKHGKFIIGRSPVSSPCYRLFSEALMDERVSANIDFNPKEGKVKPSVGRPEVLIDVRTRTSHTTLKSYLMEAITLKRDITIMPGTQCSKITKSGVVVIDSDGVVQEIKGDAVVMAAGPVGSAEVLLKSQETFPEMPVGGEYGVGANFWDSPSAVIQYASIHTGTLHCYEDTIAQWAAWMEWQYGTINSLCSGYDDMVLFFNSKYESIVPGLNPDNELVDLKITLQPFCMNNKGERPREVPHGIQFKCELVRPSSRGSVTYNTEHNKLEINPNYLQNQADRDALEKGIKFVKKFTKNSKFNGVLGSGAEPLAILFEASCKSGGTLTAGPEETQKVPFKSLETPVSSLPQDAHIQIEKVNTVKGMPEEKIVRGGCVDPATFKVRGTNDRVYVCDSSLFPHPILGDHLPFTLSFSDRFCDTLLNKKLKTKNSSEVEEWSFGSAGMSPTPTKAIPGSGHGDGAVKVTYY